MTNTNPEPATFVLVPSNAPVAYWEGWATPCGFDTVDGKVYTIVATHRTGSTGRSDAQYIIDRMASGLHFAKLQEPRPRLIPNDTLWGSTPDAMWAQDGTTPAEVHDAAPESRGMVEVDPDLWEAVEPEPYERDVEAAEALEWGGMDV
jgi:hypothetical protein